MCLKINIILESAISTFLENFPRNFIIKENN